MFLRSFRARCLYYARSLVAHGTLWAPKRVASSSPSLHTVVDIFRRYARTFLLDNLIFSSGDFAGTFLFSRLLFFNLVKLSHSPLLKQ